MLPSMFARDRSELARFFSGDGADEATEWSRLLKVDETTMGWVEDAIGPPDDPPSSCSRYE